MCLILRAGLIGTRNKKTILLSDLFQRHESNDSLRFAKRAMVEKYVFRGNHYYTILRVILIFILLGLNLEIWTYLGACFDKYCSILTFNSWFDWWLKMSILDNFSPGFGSPIWNSGAWARRAPQGLYEMLESNYYFNYNFENYWLIN